jgi:hypothetical protein
MPDQTTTIARYLAVGDAHVTVTLGSAENCPHFTRHDQAFSVTCEGCGPLDSSCAFDNYRESYLVEQMQVAAQDHAQTCRRIPERLWPEGGAR